MAFTPSHTLLQSSAERFSSIVQAPGVVSGRPPASNIEKFPVQMARTRIVWSHLISSHVHTNYIQSLLEENVSFCALKRFTNKLFLNIPTDKHGLAAWIKGRR